ncbi:MAG: aminopeptidase [Nitrospirae bacterium]|nr:aminopeptidase [Nitrospirota bacterium]
MDKRRNAIENIFRINLKVKKRERVLIFTDNERNILNKIAKKFKRAGNKFTDEIRFESYLSTSGHGKEPPEKLWKEAFGEKILKELKRKNLLNPLIAKKITEKKTKEVEKIIKQFKNDAADVIIALSHYSTTHTRFRDLLTRICGARYASMPLFDEEMLNGPMQIDWNEMSKSTKEIARRVNRCKVIEIKTPDGTQMTFSKEGRKAYTDTGIITKSGEFSNLPAGEVYLAPLEGTANGRLVLDWAPTRKLKSPVTLYVENGRVIRIEGKEIFAEYLKATLAERPDNSNIAELGIGTNKGASRPDNILESEKIFGTIHIALGDNSSFGGQVRTPFHQDFIFFKPTVILVFKKGRKILLDNGKLAQERH